MASAVPADRALVSCRTSVHHEVEHASVPACIEVYVPTAKNGRAEMKVCLDPSTAQNVL